MVKVNSEVGGYGIEDWVINLKINNLKGATTLNKYIITVEGLLTFSPQDPKYLPDLSQEYSNTRIWPVRIQQIFLSIYQNLTPLAQSFFVDTLPLNSWAQSNTGYQVPFKIDIPIDFLTVDALEKQRIDNIDLTFRLNLLAEVRTIIEYTKKVNSGANFILRPIIVSTNVTFHPDQWIELLKELKYKDLWIVYLYKPQIENAERIAFDKAFELLSSAGEALFSKLRPDRCVTDLRSAWKALEPIRKTYKEEIKKAIDKGSTNSDGETTKNEKVTATLKATEDLMDTIRNLNHIGPHQEGYTVTYQDALLAYRLSVSEISYLSYVISELSS